VTVRILLVADDIETGLRAGDRRGLERGTYLIVTPRSVLRCRGFIADQVIWDTPRSVVPASLMREIEPTIYHAIEMP
jgi:hypothetical protein